VKLKWTGPLTYKNIKQIQTVFYFSYFVVVDILKSFILMNKDK